MHFFIIEMQLKLSIIMTKKYRISHIMNIAKGIHSGANIQIQGQVMTLQSFRIRNTKKRVPKSSARREYDFFISKVFLLVLADL